MFVRGGEQIQLKFYVVIGLDVRLPWVDLIFSFIAVYWKLLAIFLRNSRCPKSAFPNFWVINFLYHG